MVECEKGCNCHCLHKGSEKIGQSNTQNNQEFLAKLYVELIDTKKGHQDLSHELLQTPGVHELRFLENNIEIYYDDMLISPEEIKELLQD